jgi:DNA-binding response OmpR family regulator
MKEQVQLDGLLFSGNTELLRVMKQILGTFSIQTEVYTEIRSALDVVSHRRVDALIVDWDLNNDPTRVVRCARKSSPNRNSTIVAMVDAGSETHALLVGANFMIYKPVDLERASRCLRAAYGTMLLERRRAARVSVDIPVIARVTGLGIIKARVSDLSVGGLALHCDHALRIDHEVSLVLSLPRTSDTLRITGRVVNGNQTGRAGIRFSFVPEEDLSALEGWLAIELAKLDAAELPLNGAGTVSQDGMGALPEPYDNTTQPSILRVENRRDH